MMKIAIINGPNLNLLGVREPAVYGNRAFEGFFEGLKEKYAGVAELTYFQSNHEGDLIDHMQSIGFDYHGIVLNADCISAITTPVIEVHISNVHSRESFRHHSMISAACKGVIAGFGLDSYRLAIEAIIGNK